MAQSYVYGDATPARANRIRSPATVHVRMEERDGGRVAFVTIDDVRRHNAMGSEMMNAFVAALTPLRADANLRCVVLTGAGERAFAGGADVDELAEVGFPSEARTFIGKVHACCAAVRELPAPVIARVNGLALGAGLELAISCDLRIAADSAVFGMPEVKLGLPSVVEAALLPGLIGWGKTREMLLLGEICDARAALAMGLVDAVAPAGKLDAAVEKRIKALFAAGLNAVRLQKALMRRWESLPLKDAVIAGADVFGQAYLTHEPAESIAVWRNRRRAKTKPPVKPAPAIRDQ
jgi:enoyl-CoA hydratase/carnithine racemase